MQVRARAVPVVSAARDRAAAPLPERIRDAWKVGLFAEVADGELAQSVDVLYGYHQQVGFFGNRFEGMRRLTDVSDEFEVQLTPNRDKVPMPPPDGPEPCVLCKPNIESERGLRWRDYSVWPNAFPYVPPESQHVVLATREHVGQGFSASGLASMIDYQRHGSVEAPLTLHYNGIAGNSQFHRHWQATRETLPLQRLLEQGRLPLTVLSRSAEGSVATFDKGFYAGILVSGRRGYVARQAEALVRELDRDPLTRGAYNMLLLHRAGGQARLVVIPRRADCLKPEIKPWGKVGVGAFHLGGIVVVPAPGVPEGFKAAFESAARQTIVRPGELAWLKPGFGTGAASSAAPARPPAAAARVAETAASALAAAAAPASAAGARATGTRDEFVASGDDGPAARLFAAAE